MKKTTLSVLAAATVVVGLVGCSSTMSSSADVDKATAEVIKSSFQAKGIATLDRIAPEASNDLCSQANVAGKPLDEKTAKAIEAANLASIKWPSDGKYLGDWKKGEKIAQSGKGLSWRDKITRVNGGNCYNCHQIDPSFNSYGTLGPSLVGYGKLRGVTDPNSPAAQAVVKYTWGKIWNSRAYNACSNMPRAGTNGILTQDQVRDLVALLLDPNSPVNK
jgi:sulfur-oxidizing protein SoxX